MEHSTEIKKTRTKKGLIISFAVVGIFLIILFGGIFGFHSFVNSKIGQAMAEWKNPPVVITATTTHVEDWKPYIEAVGNAVAINSIKVSAQASGLVSAIYFKSGEEVKKGQKLFELDSTMLQAQLKQNQANEAINKITYTRDEELLKTHAISKQTRDIAQANYAQAEAQTQTTQAQIDYTIVRAPFAGRIGIRNISVGDFFQQGSTAATLDTISPIFVDFSVSGNDISKIHVGQPVKVYSEAYPGQVFEGTVTAFDSRISSQSLGLMVRAEIKNTDKKIYPGMFITAHLMLPEHNKVVTIPETAINYTLYGDSVYVLKPVIGKDGKQETASYNDQNDPGKIIHTKNKLYITELTSIKVGQINGQKAAILEGLKPNELIASSGLIKLKGGIKVTINNTYAPKIEK